MKNRILTFIIGILTGAIITTLIFLIISKTPNNGNMNNMPQSDTPPMYKPNGENPMDRQNGNMGTPPERPTGNIEVEH